MAEVILTVVGCGDAFASGGRYHTCFHVNTGSLQCLIDCGSTAFVALKKNHIRTSDLDAIVLTHFHGDHFGGLPYIVLGSKYEAKRTKPLTIISPPGCREKLGEAMQLYYPGLNFSPEELLIEFVEYQPYQVISLGALSVQAFPVVHAEQTLPHAVQLQVENKTIAFSGDTEWTDTLPEAADKSDLFICECNFFSTPVNGHLNYQTIMENIEKFTCKKILLTHLGNEMLQNLDKVTLDCASDGQKIIL